MTNTRLNKLNWIGAALIASLAFGAFGLTGCGKDNKPQNKVDVSRQALTLGWSRWVEVSFPGNFPTDAKAIWSAGPSDVWIGAHDPNGGSGTTVALSHWNGSAWTNYSFSPAFYPNAIYGSSSTNVWAAGKGGKIAHWDGSSWTVSQIKTGFTTDLVTMWADSTGLAWVFSNSGYHFYWNTATNTWVQKYFGSAYTPNGGVAYLGGLAIATAPYGTLIYCTTGGCGYAYGPAAWRGSFYDIWGTSLSNYWVVSNGTGAGTIFHVVNGSWQNAAWGPGYYGLTDTWGSSANDVWFVGQGGMMYHWDGSSISSVASGTTATLTDIHGTASNEVWAVGTGAVLHYTDYITEADARHRVVQESSYAMTGSWTQYDETNWPQDTNPATYAYTSSDTNAWNSLVGAYGGDNVSCRQTYGTPPYQDYTECGVAYGWQDMPTYTCQGDCSGTYKHGGQCKGFMNLVAYRSGMYQNPNYGWKSLPSDASIDAGSTSPDYMPNASYDTVEPGDLLRKTRNGNDFGHALIVVRKLGRPNVVVFDSNYLSDGVPGANDEVVGSHVLTESDLNGYRVLKCVYTGGC